MARFDTALGRHYRSDDPCKIAEAIRAAAEELLAVRELSPATQRMRMSTMHGSISSQLRTLARHIDVLAQVNRPFNIDNHVVIDNRVVIGNTAYGLSRLAGRANSVATESLRQGRIAAANSCGDEQTHLSIGYR